MKPEQSQMGLAEMISSSPMGNPENASKMLTESIIRMAQFPIQMFIVNYFFKGIIVGKLPFHISLKFKELL